jgi:RHS repeat-associated protein
MMKTLGCLLGTLAISVGRLSAQETVEYYHLDGVGSVRLVSNQAGAEVERHDWLPFGEEWCPGPPPGVCGPMASGQPRRFTGKERDGETGLDYFGARYYSSTVARFTGIDPLYTWQENLGDPQRWNRYAYGRNNPMQFIDPDGREVTYASPQLQSLFGHLSGRSGTVRETLGLYTGPGKPDLFIRHAEAGKDVDGSDALGLFSAKVDVSYAGKEDQIKHNMTAEQIEDLGTWAIVGGATLTIDSSLTISLMDRRTVGTALHELGHADQAVRQPLQYKRSPEYDASGRVIDHNKRPAEVYADKYRDAASKEVNR